MFHVHESSVLSFSLFFYLFNVGQLEVEELEDTTLACIYFRLVNIFAFVFFHSISHSTHRTFGKQQWQQLHDSLTSWKANLAAVKTSLQALSPSA